MDGWNTTFLLGRPIFRGELLVSGRVRPYFLGGALEGSLKFCMKPVDLVMEPVDLVMKLVDLVGGHTRYILSISNDRGRSVMIVIVYLL